MRRELDTTDLPGAGNVGAVEFTAFSHLWMIMVASAVSMTGGRFGCMVVPDGGHEVPTAPAAGLPPTGNP